MPPVAPIVTEVSLSREFNCGGPQDDKTEILARHREYYSQIQQETIEIKQHPKISTRTKVSNLAERGSQFCSIISTHHPQEMSHHPL